MITQIDSYPNRSTGVVPRTGGRYLFFFNRGTVSRFPLTERKYLRVPEIEPGLTELSLKAANQLSHRFGSPAVIT
jgi:hypothetical protein